MDSHAPLDGGVRALSRRWLVLVITAVIVLAVLVVFAMRRNAASAAKPEDCETKPPPNAFAVAECDDGAAAGGAKSGTTVPARPAKP